MPRFEDALESNPAPRALGDVSLRYEPSMLIGETPKGKATFRSTLTWIVGVCLLVFSAGGLVLQWPIAVGGTLLCLGAATVGAAALLERFEKRRRRFVANFGTVSLRLDFTSPIAGYARTLTVPFDSVVETAVMRQGDGASCLCVDFEVRRTRLREVLVAHIPDSQRPEAQRLERVLKGAFGLGERPASAAAADPETSSFE